MNNVLSGFILTVFLSGCQQSAEMSSNDNSSADTMRIRIVTADIIGIKESDVKKTFDTTYVTDVYFEVGLYSMKNGERFMAEKRLIQPKSVENFRTKFLNIINASGSVRYFENSTEFLNYMSARGYEMTEQEKEKYVTHYTFKRKRD